MIEPLENTAVSVNELLNFFRLKATGKKGSSARNYIRAVSALTGYLNNLDCEPGALSEQILADWFIYMCLCRFSFKTSVLFFNNISGLYGLAVKEGIAQETEIFKSVKSGFKALGGIEGGVDMSAFKRIKELTRNAPCQKGESAIAADIVLLSLLSSCKSLTEIARLRREDCQELDAEKSSVVSRHMSPRRKYVFDLKQSELTDRQLERKVIGLVRGLFKSRGITQTDNLQDTIESYWAYAALQSGVSASSVVGVLGKAPKGLPPFALSLKIELLESQKAEIEHLVGNSFVDNPLRWYAMRLRQRVSFGELDERVKALKDVPAPELFYPLEEIARRINKKLVFDKQPVIRDVVFFRSRQTEVFPLFCNIGDIAWCYTTTGKPGAPYAAISETSFRNFQEAIGHYASDYHLAEEGLQSPEKGESIKILNGLFQGVEASFRDVKSEDGRSLWQLFFNSDNNISWNFEVDPRLTEIAR